MPQRILRDYTDSDKFDDISAEAERTFVRLICKADDYGRYYANARMVRATCFPLVASLEVRDVEVNLQELVDRKLIVFYEVGGKRLLAITNFRQRLRQRVTRFPAPIGMPADWMPVDEHKVADCEPKDGELSASCGQVDSNMTATCPPHDKDTTATCVPEEKGREVEVEGKTEEKKKTPIVPLSAEDWLAIHPLAARVADWFGRRTSTPWSDKEKKALASVEKLGTSDEELSMLEAYYTASIDRRDDIRRRDISTLLNNWQGEIDRARRWKGQGGGGIDWSKVEGF